MRLRASASVFSKKINSYVRIFVNMADFYVAAKIRKFVFSKALRIFAATNFGNLARVCLRCNGHNHRFLGCFTVLVLLTCSGSE